MSILFLAQVVNGAQTVQKITDSIWDKPLGWFAVAFIVPLALGVGFLIWYLVTHAGRLEADLKASTEDRVKLAGSGPSFLERFSDLEERIERIEVTARQIWEYLLRGGKE
jgi:hypothetical protein